MRQAAIGGRLFSGDCTKCWAAAHTPSSPPPPRCGAPAKLLCPKCLDLGLPKAPACFCSQACFKAGWSTHKAAHTPGPDAWAFVTRRGEGRSFKAPDFEWTGSLRPERVGPRRSVPASVKRPDYAEDGVPTSELESRQQKSVPIRSAADIAAMRAVCRAAREILDAGAAIVKPGVTTDEIDRVVHDATIERGAYPSPLNYFHFPKSVCTSVNEVVCHGIPDARELSDGDIVNIDVTAYLHGFHGDLNETHVVGKPSPSDVNLIKAASDALDAGIRCVKPGARFRDVGDAVSSVARVAGVSVVRTYCGHGIGDLFHCAPNIPHYAGNKAVGTMQKGQTFTIEPMLNAGGWRDTLWPDGWTAVTADGSRSAQFEHTLLVTESGAEVLTARLPSSPALCFDVCFSAREV